MLGPIRQVIERREIPKEQRRFLQLRRPSWYRLTLHCRHVVVRWCPQHPVYPRHCHCEHCRDAPSHPW